MKFLLNVLTSFLSMSPSVRRAWIEIGVKLFGGFDGNRSPSVRRAWIEIEVAQAIADLVNCHPP